MKRKSFNYCHTTASLILYYIFRSFSFLFFYFFFGVIMGSNQCFDNFLFYILIRIWKNNNNNKAETKLSDEDNWDTFSFILTVYQIFYYPELKQSSFVHLNCFCFHDFFQILFFHIANDKFLLSQPKNWFSAIRFWKQSGYRIQLIVANEKKNSMKV